MEENIVPFPSLPNESVSGDCSIAMGGCVEEGGSVDYGFLR